MRETAPVVSKIISFNNRLLVPVVVVIAIALEECVEIAYRFLVHGGFFRYVIAMFGVVGVAYLDDKTGLFAECFLDVVGG